MSPGRVNLAGPFLTERDNALLHSPVDLISAVRNVHTRTIGDSNSSGR